MKNFIFYLLVFIIASGFFGIIGVLLCVGADVCIDVGPDLAAVALVLGIGAFTTLCVYFYRNFIANER